MVTGERPTSHWPDGPEELIDLQHQLALQVETSTEQDQWRLPADPAIGGCFVAFARGEAGPGNPGDRAWAGAVTWRRDRQSGRVVARSVVADRVPASYSPGLLALREGPILAAAVGDLQPVPDVLLVDATGLDHPRRAGLAIHLGAALGLPTVGVTHRGLEGPSTPPVLLEWGDVAPVDRDGRRVAAWVCTRTRTRPLLIHPGWRTGLDTAILVVLAASTPDARTPAPLRHARQVAREARSAAGAG